MKIDKNIIIAGLATVGGLAILSKTPVMKREAETVVFNAKGFPKKVRLEDNLKKPSTPICKLFLDAKGDYFKYYSSSLSWEAMNVKLNFGSDNIQKYMLKKPFDERINLHEPEWFYYFNKIHNISITDLDRKLEFWEVEYTPAEQQNIINNPINYTLISKQEFEDIWDDLNNGENKDRLDAYWELYTNGTIDSKMDDERSPLYQNIHKIFGTIAEATFDNLKPISNDEQTIYDFNIEELSKAIDIKGWEFMENTFDVGYYYLSKFYGLGYNTFYDDDNKYNFSKDELVLLSEWIILRNYIMFYGYWNTNVKPLIDKGFNVKNGVLIQNIRGTWDAYREEKDAPSRYDRLERLPTTDFLEKHLFSESFITKQVIKKRPKFLQLNNKILNLEKNKEALEKEQEKNDAILKIREIVSDKDRIGIYEGFMFHREEHYEAYKTELNNNIKELVATAGDKITDADRKMLKQRWKEYLEGVKYQQIQTNKKRIEELEKANDKIEAFMKDYEDEIDKMDLKG